MGSNPRYEIVFVGIFSEDSSPHETYEVAWCLEEAQEIGAFVESLVGITDSDRLNQMTVPQSVYEEDLIVTALDFVEKHLYSGFVQEYKGIYVVNRTKIT